MSISFAKSSKSQLLYIGNEPALAKASSSLLKEAGFRVRSTSPLHVADAVRDHRFSAVIFCATLSYSEMESIVELVSVQQPGVPIISVRVGMLGDSPHPTSAAVVDALQGPQALIGAVRSITLMQPKAS